MRSEVVHQHWLRIFAVQEKTVHVTSAKPRRFRANGLHITDKAIALHLRTLPS